MIATSLSFASGLTHSAKLTPGSTILLFSPNSTLYPALLFAGQAAGLTVSTANSSYTPSELSHQLEVSGAEILLVGSDLVDTAREAAKERGIKEDKIYVLPGVDGKVVVPKGLRSYAELKDVEGGKKFKPVQLTEEQSTTRVAYLPFSSGTTGKGKGVAISAANITAVSQQLNEVKGLFDGPEVVMGVLPLYHIVSAVFSYLTKRLQRALPYFSAFGADSLSLSPPLQTVRPHRPAPPNAPQQRHSNPPAQVRPPPVLLSSPKAQSHRRSHRPSHRPRNRQAPHRRRL